jgi:peptide deformylase
MDIKLRLYSDPILRQDAEDVEVFDEALAQEVEAMVETMKLERGIGLAAPQVGMSKKLIVVLQMKDPDDVEAEPQALVNPEIIDRSKETWELEEGCLSVPGVVAKVTRPREITVRYQDLEGKENTIEAQDMFARVILHEIDHLHGRLFVDYLSSAQKSLIKPKLKNIAAEYSA